MKKYIKPNAEFWVMPQLDMILMTGVDPSGGPIIPGGGSAGGGSGIGLGGGKSRNRFEEEDEYDPIIQLLIDTEDGNTSDLW